MKISYPNCPPALKATSASAERLIQGTTGVSVNWARWRGEVSPINSPPFSTALNTTDVFSE